MADRNHLSHACTRDEALVLDMIKFWPDVPAIVTYSPADGWSVGTHPDDVERYSKSRSGGPQ
jgi:hypothetical protein